MTRASADGPSDGDMVWDGVIFSRIVRVIGRAAARGTWRVVAYQPNSATGPVEARVTVRRTRSRGDARPRGVYWRVV